MLESKRLPKSPGHYWGGGVICRRHVCGRTHVHLGKGLSHYSRWSCGSIEVVQQVIILLQKFVIGRDDRSSTTTSMVIWSSPGVMGSTPQTALRSSSTSMVGGSV